MILFIGYHLLTSIELFKYVVVKEILLEGHHLMCFVLVVLDNYLTVQSCKNYHQDYQMQLTVNNPCFCHVILNYWGNWAVLLWGGLQFYNIHMKLLQNWECKHAYRQTAWVCHKPTWFCVKAKHELQNKIHKSRHLSPNKQYRHCALILRRLEF